MSISIVIAKSNKIPEWVPKECPYTIATTSEDKSKATCYLEYIVNSYDSLPDYVLFLDKTPFTNMTISQTAFINALTNEPCILYDRTAWTQVIKCLADGRPHHPGLQLNYWTSRFFPGQQPPNVYEFSVGAQFMCSSQRIRSHPKSFYEGLLNNTKTNELDDFTMERLWYIVFYGIQRQT